MTWRLIVGLALVTATSRAQETADVGDVRLTYLEDRVRVTIQGALFTEYRFKDTGRPVLHPLNATSDRAVTRSWPLGDALPGEARDHPHHRSVWFAHGEVNGHDFWAEGRGRGRIEHAGFLVKARDRFTTKNVWRRPDGEVVCTDTRTLRFLTRGTSRIVEYGVCVAAGDQDLVFGDTKEGTMAVRVAAPLRTKGGVARGRMVNSEGGEGRGIWGKRARWVDYSGPLGDGVVGVAILDHPGNPRHPTRWHARDYGLLAANPFGLHHFEGKKKGVGDLTIKAHGSKWWRYALVVHEGDEKAAAIEALWQAWAASAK